MKKVLAGILIFDMLLGILCLAVGTERYAEQKSYGTYIETDTGVCGTSGEPKKIALTFDDGPHPKYTEQLLDEDIVVSTEKADGERSAAVAAVKNISDIIEETAGSAETVNDVANKLLNHVEKLSTTASVLDENMEGLKNEISVFKI